MASQYEKRQKAKKDSEVTGVVHNPSAEDFRQGEPPANPGVTRDAYDVFLDTERNKYIRVRINYNLETGKVEIVKVEDYADGQAVAQAKINEVFVRKMFKLDYK